MSHVQVEPLGPTRAPSQSFSGQPEHLSRRTVITIDDDDDFGRPTGSGSSRGSQSHGEGHAHPTHQRRMNSYTPVVIDDTVDQSVSPSHNGAQNRPILVLDSDEEQSGSGSQPRSHGLRRRRGRSSSSSFRIFSPSPPGQQLPRNPPIPPPVIAGPLPFAVLPPAPNLNRNRLPFDEPPQPSSRGRNSHGGIHLGGGLLSQAGRAHVPRAQLHFQRPRPDDFDELFDDPPPDRPPNAFPLDAIAAQIGRFVRSYVPGVGSGSGATSPSGGRRNRTSAGGRRAMHDLPFHLEQLADAHAGAGPGAGFFGLAFSGGAWARRDAALGLGPDYEKGMTHPGRPGPGWTFDFGAEHDDDEEDAKEGDVGAEILVCARCMDPLIANAEGMVDVSEEERKERRVWGLRCGHVLDGKCVGALMRPDVIPDAKAKGKGMENQGNGKWQNVGEDGTQKESQVRDAEEKEVNELVEVQGVKGKGKEKMHISPQLPDRAPTPPPPSIDVHNLREAAAAAHILGLEDNSIRSRLRSRRTIEPSSSVFPAPASSSTPTSPRRSARVPSRGMPVPLTGSPAVTTRRRGAKRKRMAEEEARDIVEDRWEWLCPVTGCGRQHTSIKVGGLWKMDENFGAVGIFV